MSSAGHATRARRCRAAGSQRASASRDNVDLTVHAGEVVGVAGLLGSGRSALARVLFGIDPKTQRGDPHQGQARPDQQPRGRDRQGIALVPEDRLRQGSCIEHSIESNTCLSVLDRISNWLFIRPRRSLSRSRIARSRRLRIKTASRDAAARTLSGGNQQKVVIAKWLNTEPDLLDP